MTDTPRFSPDMLPHASLTIPCDVRRIGEGVAFVREFTRQACGTSSALNQVEVAAEEAIVNAVDHGSACQQEKTVEITCMLEGRSLWIVVKDHGGRPFNPQYFLRIATKKVWGKGGRGILLINQVMDAVSYIFLEGVATTLVMRKDLTPPGAPDRAPEGA